VAGLVWERFGNVANYVEPFAGTLAVLLGRPHDPGTETVNDIDCMIANVWRAMQSDPDAVAEAADRPVNEADQHAIHLWLVTREEFRERMKTDIDYYDPLIAGRWLYGQCIWIGSGWCAKQLPHLGDAGKGLNRKRPHLGNAGKGLNRQLPHLGDAGTVRVADPEESGPPSGTREYLFQLAARLRRVRVCCGDWSRICGPSVTFKHGITGVFLDPPYSDEAERTEGLYASDSGSVAHQVREWALEAGKNPLMRVALCGYEGEHAMPGWTEIAWKANGGYSSQAVVSNQNCHRERIWFSPYCLRQETLFS